MTSEETMYVKKLGVYSGVTVYALYPNQSMLEDLRRLGWRSWLEGLAKWFAKAIQSSSSLYRIATSSVPFPLPRARFGEEERKETLSLWARTLDDLVICKIRGYHSVREQRERILKRAPHIEIRTSEDSVNAERSLFLEMLKQYTSPMSILTEVEPLLEVKVGNIILRGNLTYI